jgi:uncharacterized protein (TIGR00369 family)
MKMSKQSKEKKIKDSVSEKGKNCKAERNSKPTLLERIIASRVPVADLIGFKMEEIADGKAIATMETGPKHSSPTGAVHGGILCDLSDAAMGMAFASTLAEGESLATLELKINFLRPVWRAKLKAVAKVIQRGKLVGYVECEIFDENNRLIAKANSTCLVLRGDKAEGRELLKPSKKS